jgi:hypothetical protein
LISSFAKRFSIDKKRMNEIMDVFNMDMDLK